MKDDIWENRSRKAKEKPRVENHEAKSSLKCPQNHREAIWLERSKQ